MFCNPFVTLIVRHALGAVGAVLIQKVLLEQGAVDDLASKGAEIITGVLCSGGAVVWSVLDKAQNGIFGLFGRTKSHSEISEVVQRKRAK